MNFLYDAFPEFEFFEDDGSKLFRNASPNVSDQSSDLTNNSCCV